MGGRGNFQYSNNYANPSVDNSVSSKEDLEDLNGFAALVDEANSEEEEGDTDINSEQSDFEPILDNAIDVREYSEMDNPNYPAGAIADKYDPILKEMDVPTSDQTIEETINVDSEPLIWNKNSSGLNTTTEERSHLAPQENVTPDNALETSPTPNSSSELKKRSRNLVVTELRH